MKVHQIRIDNSLLYLISSMMKEAPDDVIYYVHQLAMTTVADFLKQKRGKNLNRTLKFFYKNNKLLPIKVQVYSYGLNDQEYTAKYDVSPKISVEVKFNSSLEYILENQIDEIVTSKLEKDMGLTSEYVNVLAEKSAPKIKLNKNIRGVLSDECV